MSTVLTPGHVAGTRAETRRPSKGQRIVSVITTTDHKVIGNLYFATSMFFFILAGIMALVIRAELYGPGLQVVHNLEQFNQMFTMHGSIMLLLLSLIHI